MIRWLLRLTGSIRLRDEDLLAIAKQHCQEAGWSWTEPIFLQHRLFRTLVTTNSDMRGGNVRILIDARSGKIVTSGFANR